MKVKFNNSSLIFNVREKEVIVDLDVVLTHSPGRTPYPAAKSDGTKVNSGAYYGYYVDLTGLYENGFRKVKFKANQKSSDKAYTMGTVCSSPIPNDNSTTDVVESFIKNDIQSLSAEWYELPITSNSRCLHATYCYSNQYAPGVEVWTPVNGDAKASSYNVEA